MTRRAAGLILHPTSLPGPHAVGGLGPEAEHFLDWATAAGQTIWQVLPLGPTGHGNSPYAALSAHAGNPLLISRERLQEEGLLPPHSPPPGHVSLANRVDYGAAAEGQGAMLRASWDHFRRGAPDTVRAEFEAFRRSPEQADWLGDWTIYAALKSANGGAAWTEWARELRRREPAALARASHHLRDEIDYRAYLQFLFFRQWHRLRESARARGVALLGDVPIYLAGDSAEVWARPHLFQLDESLSPVEVAGVPPDYFSKTGQLWGNPLYRWDRIEAEGFDWWIRRVRAELRKFDLLRLDHFRGFSSYWSIPARSKTAASGRWVEGPGRKLFHALQSSMGDLPLIAEDLGEITDEVRALLRETGLPGMRVMQFGFDAPDSEHAPHRFPVRCVAYTGTHDNDTTRGWFEKLGTKERSRVLAYVGGDEDRIEWEMIRALYASAAERAIVPVQDVLGLSSEGRMNTPSVPRGNWEFRVSEGALTTDLAARLREMAEATARR